MSWKLRPRQHMDKLSEYYFEILFEHKEMQQTCRYLYSFGFEIYHFITRFIFFAFYSVRALCIIAKQRIDSGFFLFQAEQKKKADKKKNRKKLKTKNISE